MVAARHEIDPPVKSHEIPIYMKIQFLYIIEIIIYEIIKCKKCDDDVTHHKFKS